MKILVSVHYGELIESQRDINTDIGVAGATFAFFHRKRGKHGH